MAEGIIEKLHNHYAGAQNAALESHDKSINFKHDGIVKETRTFTFECDKPKKITHIIDDYIKDPSSREAYTNFKISPSQDLQYIELEIGGGSIEKLSHFRYLGTEPQIYQMSGGRAIPALAYHATKLIFQTERACTFTISYDVVTPINNSNSDERSEDIFDLEQCTGTKELSDRIINIIPISYNHPIEKIYAHISTDDVKDVRIMLDDNDYDLVLKKEHNYYIIDFGTHPINFSRIRKAKLIIVTSTPHPGAHVNIFGISKQIIRRMRGMCGQAYSH